MTPEIQVVFQPSGRSVFVLPGTPLSEAAARAGLILESPCGGTGKCGKCLVRVVRGNCPPCPREREVIGTAMTTRGYRMACQCRVTGDLVIEVPESSLFQSGQKILLDHAAGRGSSGAADDGRLGAAFDIGTTTIVGTLVDLADGRELAVHGLMNPQTSYGDDVISRIKRCRESATGLRELHEAVIGAVHTILDQLIRESGKDRNHIDRIAFAGNTAMQQILCAIDPSPLGEFPFTPSFIEPPDLRAADLNLKLRADCPVYVFPQIGGFVGGDTVAGILATQLDQSKGATLFVDIGTNGEIVLTRDGRLVATSVAAGPAFEGARIVNGMRAAAGAIEKVVIEGDVLKLNVIGNVRPAGICGSGLVDAVAELLRARIVDETGRIPPPDELPDSVPPLLRQRVVQSDDGYDFLLVDADDSVSGQGLFLYQRDVRQLQLANAAIRTGINLLLRREGLEPDQLAGVLLAGAFGNFIRRSNAIRIGMLPDLPHERIRFVGNTSSAGARLAVLSAAERRLALEIVRKTTHLDLSREPDFTDEFANAMLFPEN